MRKALLILPALMALSIGVVFAHGWDNNTTGEGNFLQDMLDHFRVVHNEPDAQINDMLEFHRQMHGNESVGDMIQMHKQMHGDSKFAGCPMHDAFDE